MNEFPSLTEVLTQHRPYGLDCKCGRPINSDKDWAQHVSDAWDKACTVTTATQLESLPPESIVKTDGGSIACRHYDRVHGVVFGDDRPFKWSVLAAELPGYLMRHPDWPRP
ncbi:hypothetical protein [Mycolicibacterium sphagni]|uniref:hypothetical protein n=1 Tax=Mycolicibacterium sphagni TaxID=1786 RepID=UPI0021F29E83|nr:hypothetical protein [Mycolicibacterium sphagni]MCV7175101.1 hypothetical protein [Mycolicibacterium sphagni]